MPEPEKVSEQPKIVVATFVLLPPVRSEHQVRSLSISSQTTEINMNLKLEADDFPAYRDSLTGESGSVNLWRSGKVKATAKV
jgi:hypothetical protein